MTRDEILALSDEELEILAAEGLGWLNVRVCEHPRKGREIYGRFPRADCMGSVLTPRFLCDMNAAMDLFNEVFNPRSKLYGGTWVLGTVDSGKDCSLATLFFKKKLLSRHRPEKVQAKAKPKQMARAVTLCYIMAMEGAVIEFEYQPDGSPRAPRRVRPGTG